VVVLAGEKRLEFDLLHAADDPVELLIGLGEKGLVAALAREFVRDLRVLERAHDLGERRHLGLDQFHFVDCLPGALGPVPEVGGAHPRLEVLELGELGLVVKESRGWLRSAPRDRR